MEKLKSVCPRTHGICYFKMPSFWKLLTQLSLHNELLMRTSCIICHILYNCHINPGHRLCRKKNYQSNNYILCNPTECKKFITGVRFIQNWVNISH